VKVEERFGMAGWLVAALAMSAVAAALWVREPPPQEETRTEVELQIRYMGEADSVQVIPCPAEPGCPGAAVGDRIPVDWKAWLGGVVVDSGSLVYELVGDTRPRT
jgi:hypothetical protein